MNSINNGMGNDDAGLMRAPKNSIVPFSPNRVNRHSKTKLLNNNGRRFPPPMLKSPSNKTRPSLTIPRLATHILQMRPYNFTISTLEEKVGMSLRDSGAKNTKSTNMRSIRINTVEEILVESSQTSLKA